jgi:hypothetical protein
MSRQLRWPSKFCHKQVRAFVGTCQRRVGHYSGHAVGMSLQRIVVMQQAKIHLMRLL